MNNSVQGEDGSIQCVDLPHTRIKLQKFKSMLPRFRAFFVHRVKGNKLKYTEIYTRIIGSENLQT